jgi:hypothetical protein
MLLMCETTAEFQTSAMTALAPARRKPEAKPSIRSRATA